MNLKKPIYSALIFFSTLGALSIGYGAYNALSPVNTGDPLTKTIWNQMADNIADLNTRVSTLASSGSLWTSNGSDISYTAGNVGIGISAPDKQLHIKTSSGNAEINIQSMNKDKWGIYHGGEDLIFWNLKNILTLQKNGNVGIGTSTPQANLTIQNETDGSDTITQLRSSDSGFGTNQELRVDFQQTLTTTARQSMAYFGPDWGFNFYGYVSGLNATPILTMRGNSKVGIGTTNPGTKLDIKSTRTSGNNENLITLSDPVTGLQTPGFGTRILGSSNAGNALSAIGFEAGTTGTNNDTQLSFYTQSSAGGLAQRMVVNQVGNIGIGVSNPGSKLEVKGDIKIKGVSGGGGTPIDLGLNINGGNGGATSLVLCSMNHGAGDNTISAIYMIRSGYDGNNYGRYYLGGSSDYVTFTIDGSGNLFYTGPAGNNQCSVFKSSR